MTIADIDKRLAEIDDIDGCVACGFYEHELRHNEGEYSHDFVSIFEIEVKALKALRAVLVLCEKAEKAVSEMRVTSTSATIVVPIRDIRAAIDSAFEGEADV